MNELRIIKKIEILWLRMAPGRASYGNPGAEGIGATARNHNSEMINVLIQGLGVTTSYIAENYAIANALNGAVEKG
ncbi:hypothetical protein GIB67_003446 [Kingdonia uniflora]|uniref:Uncharacterized protein n=1 Tax=Kingdonia uniflora TaxID=39325 RepID=A0A7J7P9U7_9MAGN|nr:hypothetical protein GIB67_003446 [Kingdonia uniflora]